MQRQDKAYAATSKLSALFKDANYCVANVEINIARQSRQCKNKNTIEIDVSNISFCV